MESFPSSGLFLLIARVRQRLKDLPQNGSFPFRDSFLGFCNNVVHHFDPVKDTCILTKRWTKEERDEVTKIVDAVRRDVKVKNLRFAYTPLIHRALNFVLRDAVEVSHGTIHVSRQHAFVKEMDFRAFAAHLVTECYRHYRELPTVVEVDDERDVYSFQVMEKKQNRFGITPDTLLDMGFSQTLASEELIRCYHFRTLRITSHVLAEFICTGKVAGAKHKESVVRSVFGRDALLKDMHLFSIPKSDGVIYATFSSVESVFRVRCDATFLSLCSIPPILAFHPVYHIRHDQCQRPFEWFVCEPDAEFKPPKGYDLVAWISSTVALCESDLSRLMGNIHIK
jgi:hypothetical protein